MHEKQKSHLITSDQSENMPFFDVKIIFSRSFSHANQPKANPYKRNLGKFFRNSPAVTKGLKKVTNLFRIGLFPHKTVRFAHCSTKQVCNVKKKNLLCLINVNGNFLIQMIEISVEEANFKSKMAVTVTSYMTSSHFN